MIGYIQKKLITLMLLFELVMPVYMHAMIVPDYIDVVAGVIPVVLSSMVAGAQRLPGPRGTIFGAGVVVGSALYAYMREWTPSRIVDRGQELIDTIDRKASICFMLNSKEYNGITIDLIKQISKNPFITAQDECDKFLPIIQEHYHWINKLEEKSQEVKEIKGVLKQYEARIRAINLVINNNKKFLEEEEQKCNNEESNKKKLQREDADLKMLQENNKSTKFQRAIVFFNFLILWWKEIMLTLASIPTLYMIFKVTFRMARFL